MHLSKDQVHQVEEWLNSRNVNPNCMSCDGDRWKIGNIIAPPLLVSEGDGFRVQHSGEQIPMVQIICKNCGFVRLYAAKKVGLT